MHDTFPLMGSMRFGTRSSSSAAAGAGCGARVGLLLFGLVFFGMGAVFVGLIASETWAISPTRI